MGSVVEEHRETKEIHKREIGEWSEQHSMERYRRRKPKKYNKMTS
jgi:hypothetical protein